MVLHAARLADLSLISQDEIVSMISRNSIDSLKDNFWDKVSTDQKVSSACSSACEVPRLTSCSPSSQKLIKALKPIFNIP